MEGQSFGAWLRGHMSDRDLTQQQVAEAIGVRQQTVSKYLAGDEIPRTERVEALASILGVSVFEVFDAVAASIGATPLEPGDREAQLERLRHIEDEARRLRLRLGESGS